MIDGSLEKKLSQVCPGRSIGAGAQSTLLIDETQQVDLYPSIMQPLGLLAHDTFQGDDQSVVFQLHVVQS